MAQTDPLLSLRSAVARAVAPTAETRLVTIDAADLAPAAGAVHVPLASPGRAAPPGTARADPLRLPLVEGLADAIVARDDLGAEAKARLREFWRVLAPAGVLVMVVAVPSSWSLWSIGVRAYRRGNLIGALGASMFALDGIVVVPGAIVARATKADGLGPTARRRTVKVQRRAPA